MGTLEKIMMDTTSTKSENSTFKREVLETAICHCGKEYAYRYKTIIFGKEHEYTDAQCYECRMKQNEREYQDEQNQIYAEKCLKKFNSESLVNPKLKLATFETYQSMNEQLLKAKAICERYANNFDLDNPVNLLLIGNYGTGKSHLAVSISKEVITNKFKSALFISTPKLLTKLRSTYSRTSCETEEEIINQLTKVSLLVLDDIGSEQVKPINDTNEQNWATSKIFEIIDNRIGKHTVFTTNYDINELQQRIGSRNFSRMMENTHVVKMYGEDYRLRDFK